MNVAYQPPPAVWNGQTGQYDYPPGTGPAAAPPPAPSAAALGAQAGFPPSAPAAPAYPLPVQPTATAPTQGRDMRGYVKTNEVRFNWFFVLRRDKKGKQRTQILVPKGDVATYQAMQKAIQEALAKKWPGQAPQYYATSIRDGDTYRNPDTGKPLEDVCKGHWVINCAGSTQLVRVIDPFGSEITDPNSVVSGDFGRVSLTFYGSDKENKIGVFACLNNVQFTRKGEPLGGQGGIAAEDEFDIQAPPAGYVPPAYVPPAPMAPTAPAYGAPGQPAPGQPVAGFNAPPTAPVYGQPVAPPPYAPTAPAYVAPPPPPSAPPPAPVWNGHEWVLPG